MITDSVTSSQMMAAEQDMVSALRARRAFLEQLLVEKRELLNEICLQEAVRILDSLFWS